ncbi:unnamed protein product [Notodromas monacha]|uniref:[histone H3]-dimethyl-L-lysine(36) demethylase n=1 Tax=Notodromas monacha TaxID=399045 RepID=A0A7R9BEB9_9CRUS|nr:unnamed protein product [Notodromas monacha]CAG0913770.1 unnamed protein product [Notodromas monacha]
MEFGQDGLDDDMDQEPNDYNHVLHELQPGDPRRGFHGNGMHYSEETSSNNSGAVAPYPMVQDVPTVDTTAKEDVPVYAFNDYIATEAEAEAVVSPSVEMDFYEASPYQEPSLTEHPDAIVESTTKEDEEVGEQREYSEDEETSEDSASMWDDDEARDYNIRRKIFDAKFNTQFHLEMRGEDFNMAYVQENGFQTPIRFVCKDGLDLKVPSKCTVKDIRKAVGSERMVDVMNTDTQENLQMSMQKWHQYWRNPVKSKRLNVISLEFSKSELDKDVTAPAIVRQLDWTDRAWPRHLKSLQTEPTNMMGRMMYPKVQKYALMSVQGSYTDFHVDFGGTSVWYHLVSGRKVFLLIPPTSENLELYQKWSMSPEQSQYFFGEMVEQCSRIILEAGHTFMIPTGWIHAVYTPKDSVVFGGNFLHSFQTLMQCRIFNLEIATKVTKKFQFPFFVEMHWYVLARYVGVLMGKNHLQDSEVYPESSQEDPKFCPGVYLTSAELHALKVIVWFLYSLAPKDRCVPGLLKSPADLIRDIRFILTNYKVDRERAVTGHTVLLWTNEEAKNGQIVTNSKPQKRIALTEDELAAFKKARGKKRRRRLRCKACEACLRSDCGVCVFCVDMPKFGGRGRLRQACHERQCLNPSMRATSVCLLCNLKESKNGERLHECLSCSEMTHVRCSIELCPGEEGKVLDVVSSLWVCCKCMKNGSGLKEIERFERRNIVVSNEPVKVKKETFGKKCRRKQVKVSNKEKPGTSGLKTDKMDPDSAGLNS